MLTGHSRFAGTAGMAAVILLLAACGSTSSSSTASRAAATVSGNGQSTPAAPPSTVRTAKTSAGTYLVGPDGRAVYLWVADPKGSSICNGECAKAWPPLTTTAAPTGASGVSASELSTVTRSDGVKQVTYAGHPLYYFVGDAGAGTTTGQGTDGFGAKWWIVSPAGSAITSSTTASSSGSASSGGGKGVY